MKGRYEDQSYLNANPTWHAEDSPWKAAQIHRLIARNGLRPKTVCEVGSGAGGVLIELMNSMPGDVRFDGWDVSPQAHQMAAPRSTDRLSFHHGDFLEADSYHDLTLLIDVIEHVEDHFSFMRQLKARSENVIVHIPMALSASAVLRADRLADAWDKVGHIHVFNRSLFERFISDVGYEAIDWFYTWGSIDHPRRALSKLAWLPRRALSRLSPDLAARTVGGASIMALLR